MHPLDTARAAMAGMCHRSERRLPDDWRGALTTVQTLASGWVCPSRPRNDLRQRLLFCQMRLQAAFVSVTVAVFWCHGDYPEVFWMSVPL